MSLTLAYGLIVMPFQQIQSIMISLRALVLALFVTLCISQNVTQVVFFGDFSFPQTQVFTGTNFYNFAQNLQPISSAFNTTIVPLQLYNTQTCNTTCIINALVYEMVYSPPSGITPEEQLYWLQCFTNGLYPLNTIYVQSSVIAIANSCAPAGVSMTKVINDAKTFNYSSSVTDEQTQYLMGNYSLWPNATSAPELVNVLINQDETMSFLPFGGNNNWIKNVAQQACQVIEGIPQPLPSECSYFNN